jgi:hypothetical protein
VSHRRVRIGKRAETCTVQPQYRGEWVTDKALTSNDPDREGHDCHVRTDINEPPVLPKVTQRRVHMRSIMLMSYIPHPTEEYIGRWERAGAGEGLFPSTEVRTSTEEVSVRRGHLTFGQEVFGRPEAGESPRHFRCVRERGRLDRPLGRAE